MFNLFDPPRGTPYHGSRVAAEPCDAKWASIVYHPDGTVSRLAFLATTEAEAIQQACWDVDARKIARQRR